MQPSLGLLLVFLVLVSSAVMNANPPLKINQHYVFVIRDHVLDHVTRSSFPASKELNLSNRGWKSIEPGAFDSLEHLEILDLSRNQLTVLPKFIFMRLKNLKYLSLADNNILNFRYVFKGLNNLVNLDISRNKMMYLDVSSFAGLGKSTNIRLEGNSVTTIGRSLSKQIIACILNGIVLSVSFMAESDSRVGVCREIKLAENGKAALLNKMGIVGFRKGWYQLEDCTVNTLILTHNAIADVNGILDDLPEEIKTIDLSNNVIERLRTIKNPNLRVLKFGSNKIRHIDDDAFKNMRLWVLILNDNQLIDTHFASHLPETVTKIELRENQIRELSAGSFTRLKKLAHLNLDENEIREIKSDSFRGLKSLKLLSLEANQLTTIEFGAFHSLDALLNLNMRSNYLKRLTRGIFNGLKSIKKINVSLNNIAVIERDVFHELLETLETLHMFGNEIERIETGTFMRVPTVLLNLENNRIKKIGKGAFYLPHLKTLYLHRNMLGQLNYDSFRGLRSLRELNLSYNRIERIEKGWTPYMGALRHLDISNNPLKELRNGAFHGLSEERCIVKMSDVPIVLMQRNLFDDV